MNTMKVILTSALVLWCGICFAEVNVVASIPDLGDMAKRIGGDRIKLTVLASGREDLHGVPARPSFIPKLHKADLLISLGLDAEHSWLPALAAEARNNRIMEYREGWIEVHEGVQLLDIPEVISRSEGEQHAEGNPHINIGPQNGRFMAENIAYALMEFDPEGSSEYDANLTEYSGELDSLVAVLKDKGAALAGIKVISYHADISYLATFYGMDVVGTLEPKPGIEPTARHLAQLSKTAQKQKVQLVIYNQAQPSKLPEKFADRIGISAVQIGNMAGAVSEAGTWGQLQQYNLQQLLEGMDLK
ncbi:MAG: zinc ABC transporter substrate-binding protein [bacterium]|nr:zinc ABC transporter substrate-binding protein [bacterium]